MSMTFLQRLPIALALFTAALIPNIAGADDSAEDKLRDLLPQKMPGLIAEEITKTQIPGLYEVVSGGMVLYATADGNYLFNGDLIALNEQKNITEERRTGLVVGALSSLNEQELITYPAEGEEKHSVYVFTDHTCPYCRKLHEGVPQLQAAGISVHYLLYPRAGLGSSVHNEMVSMWCAKDPAQAVHNAKSGGGLPAAATCENPVEKHVALAQSVGLRGTPLMVLDNGMKIPGYLSASDLIARFNAG